MFAFEVKGGRKSILQSAHGASNAMRNQNGIATEGGQLANIVPSRATSQLALLTSAFAVTAAGGSTLTGGEDHTELPWPTTRAPAASWTRHAAAWTHPRGGIALHDIEILHAQDK